MPAFDTPNENDFLAQLHMQIERHVGLFLKARQEIDSRAERAGATRSSMHLLQLLGAIDEHLEGGVAAILGELRRAIGYPELDATELRSLTAPRCNELLERLIDAARAQALLTSFRSEQLNAITESRIERARQNIQFWLRQFDIGWDEPVEPETLKPPPNSH